MSVISKSDQNLQIAYEIAIYLQNIQVDDAFARTIYKDFDEGPIANSNQTSQGLILEVWDQLPYRIITKYGTWQILDNSYTKDYWLEKFPYIIKHLGLEFLEKTGKNKYEYKFYYAITKWINTKLEKPKLKKENFLPCNTVQKVWNLFAIAHKDLKIK